MKAHGLQFKTVVVCFVVLTLFRAEAVTTVTLAPKAWGFFADGGGGPIDGVVDYSESNNRVVAGYSSTTPEIFRGIYEFDLNPNSFSTVSATLTLRVYEKLTGSGPTGALPFQLFGYTGNGAATSADYAAGSFVSNFTLSSIGVYTLDVSGFVTSVFNTGGRYAGFNIRPNGDPYADTTAFFLGSPNAGPPSSSLTITPVPEPGMLSFCVAWFLGSLRRSVKKAKL